MLEAHNISLSINGTPILQEISCRFSVGEMVGLIGPNGSGKTTLFNCLNGFVQPQLGSLTYKGKDITTWHPADRARLGIGRVFQNFGIFREMTLLDNIVVALESRERRISSLWPWSKAVRAYRAKALEYLSQIKLDSKADQKAGSLSGGQMRLLEITRTLASGSDLFLLDEPTAGVSPKMKDDVASVILHLKSLKKTVVVIEHDINFIQKFCDRIVVLDVGRLVLDGTPDTVRQSPLLQEIYFGN